MKTNTTDPLAAHEILIDTREKRPLRFPPTIRTVTSTLQTGDYTIRGYEHTFTVERKSIADLISTLTRERARFERELQRMTEYAFRRVIVEGSYRDMIAHITQSCARYRRQVRVNAVLGTINAFEVRYAVPFAFSAGGPAEAAERVANWARYFLRERDKHGARSDDIFTPSAHEIEDVFNRSPSPYYWD